MKKVLKTMLCLMAAMMMMASVAFAATLTGTVEEGDLGLVLMVGDESYQLQGEDLDDFIGENVNVTGEIAETENGKVIEVAEIVVAQ